jgi:uncharacterized protein YndB with AHSA1/START domain
MTTIAIIAIVLALLIAALLVLAASKPDTFRVQRSASIAAPADKIFPHLNDLHAHHAWSPFEKDPAMKRTHSGAPAGKGAVYEWEGNREVGKGRIAITESVPSSRLVLALDMLKPFQAHNTVEYTLEPKGNATNLTWAMYGRQPFMAKLMSTFINCDKMVGSQFELGLANLKAIAER